MGDYTTNALTTIAEALHQVAKLPTFQHSDTSSTPAVELSRVEPTPLSSAVPRVQNTLNSPSVPRVTRSSCTKKVKFNLALNKEYNPPVIQTSKPIVPVSISSPKPAQSQPTKTPIYVVPPSSKPVSSSNKSTPLSSSSTL